MTKRVLSKVLEFVILLAVMVFIAGMDIWFGV